MASTRNKNTSLDYKLEAAVNKNLQQHNLYINSSYGRPTSVCIPAVGYTPSHMGRESLANNPVDIESALYGIGSTNLVNPMQPVNPSIKTLDFKDFFYRPDQVILPYPLVHDHNQRPFPV